MKQRLDYIDAMRGIVMIFVIYGHVALFSYGGVTLSSLIITSFHVPVFFFISGLFAFPIFRKQQFGSFQSVCSFIGKKFRTLMVPTIIFTALFAELIYAKGGFFDVLPNMGFMSYWFTYALFVYFIITLLVHLILSPLRNREIGGIILFVASIFVFLLNMFGKISLPSYLLQSYLLPNFQFFAFGVLVGMNLNKFIILTEKQWIKSLVIFGFIFSCYYYITIEPVISTPLYLRTLHAVGTLMTKYFGIILLFILCHSAKEYFSGESRIAKFTRFVGANTLAIYMFQNFLLPDLRFLKPFTKVAKHFTIEIFMTLSITLAIVLICIVINHILSQSNFIRKWLLGK